MLKYDELTAEQQRFIDYAKAGKNVLVDACIGSGKTTAIQALCMSLPVEKRILYLTYNKLLKLDAKAKIRRKGCTVTNYHSFVLWQLIQNDKRPPANADMLDWYVAQDLPVPRYDVLIIDEYQDVDNSMADVVQHVVDANPGIQVVMVGDMAQKIYDRTRLDAMSFATAMVGLDAVFMEFTQCFRIGREWADIIGSAWGKEIHGVNDDFQVEVMDIGRAMDEIVDLEPHRILCLGRNTGGLRSVLLNHAERSKPSVFNKTTVWSATTETGVQSTSPDDKCAIFTTFDGCKGMERDVCFVCDWTEGYLETRLEKPNARADILRNVFLVAASRGKRRIIFVEDARDMGDSQLLNPMSLVEATSSGMIPAKMNISEMFDFKYDEDIKAALSLLHRERLDSGTSSRIDVPLQDALIDISACVGIWQEVMYFKDTDIDAYVRDWVMNHPNSPRLRKSNYDELSIDDKILYYTALSTGQWRYDEQVTRPFITDRQAKAILSRLGSRLGRDETTQVECAMPVTHDGRHLFFAIGRCDVERPDGIWELKFTSQLEPTHFLQLASYMIARKRVEGILWNVCTDERWLVTIPDRKAFVESVAKCVTKGTFGHGGPMPDLEPYARRVPMTSYVNGKSVSVASGVGITLNMLS